jgi:ADP-ribosylglycohydrolase
MNSIGDITRAVEPERRRYLVLYPIDPSRRIETRSSADIERKALHRSHTNLRAVPKPLALSFARRFVLRIAPRTRARRPTRPRAEDRRRRSGEEVRVLLSSVEVDRQVARLIYVAMDAVDEQTFLRAFRGTIQPMPTRSDNQSKRIERGLLSLEGLSLGDAFGERFFGEASHAVQRIKERRLPPSPWTCTDDTEMATALTEVLIEYGHVDQSALARAFVRRYIFDPNRGYGAGAREILHQIRTGASWKQAAGDAFDGKGSMGNGGAMRVAPLGAFFADDMDMLVKEASASAQVTHAHPDGQAGAVAVAAAAAFAHLKKHVPNAVPNTTLLEFAAEHCSLGPTRSGLERARALASDTTVEDAVRALGNGSKVIASDTVPFALWCAQKHLDDCEEALWTTVSGLGDRDTTCAIVGGVVALHSPLPGQWVEAREALRFEGARADQRGVLDAATDDFQAWVWGLRGNVPKQR